MKGGMVPWKKNRNEAAFGFAEDPVDWLRREINDLFDSAGRDVGRPGRPMADSAGWELSETDDEIRVQVDLPGMEKEDVEVLLEENTLIIRGERREQQEKKKRKVHLTQMSYGGFCRSILLPAEVDAGAVKTRFKRGVLTLTFPKTERAKTEPRRIPGQSG
jgi:HSP20 family protein